MVQNFLTIMSLIVNGMKTEIVIDDFSFSIYGAFIFILLATVVAKFIGRLING